MERGRRINEKQTSGPPDWTSQEHAGRKGPERAVPHAGSAAVRPGARPRSRKASRGRWRGLGPARAPPSSPRPSPAPRQPPLASSPCARGLPRAVAAPVLSPGVVRHVPDEQRRVGGAQVAGHGGGTNGLSKPSAAPPAAPSHSHSHPEPEGSATATASSRETSLPPPLPLPRPTYHPAPAAAAASAAPARTNGFFPRDLARPGARAAAAALVIGSRLRSFPPCSPFFLSLALHFPALFCLAAPSPPHLVLAGECFQLPWLRF